VKWLIVKIVNLFIVLVVVTFLVAAIFTGPLAQREINNIYTDVQAMVREMFRNKPYVTIFDECIKRSANNIQVFNRTIDNVTNNLINNPGQITLLVNLSDDVRSKVISAVGEAMKIKVTTYIKQNQKVSNEQLYKDVTREALRILHEEGITVNETFLYDFVKEFTSQVIEECRKIIVEAEVQVKIHQKGLDQPWFLLSLRYTKMLLTFQPLKANQLTTQYYPHQGDRNTLNIIIERIPFSVSLFTTSSILTLLIAMPLALLAARRPGNIIDNIITAWSVFSVSMPWWWLAMVFIYIFTVRYNIFPSPYDIQPDWGAVFKIPAMLKGEADPAEVLAGIKSILVAAALPVFTVTILSIGDTAYRIRNILLDVFNEDFVTVARAKGVPEHIVLRKHVMRPAAPPLITIVLFSIVLSIFAGAIITELIFNWYGLGRLYWEAIVKNDIPLILELTYITTLLYLIIRFILDVLYTILDPRIRRA